jgi:hypothetical protein
LKRKGIRMKKSELIILVKNHMRTAIECEIVKIEETQEYTVKEKDLIIEELLKLTSGSKE